MSKIIWGIVKRNWPTLGAGALAFLVAGLLPGSQIIIVAVGTLSLLLFAWNVRVDLENAEEAPPESDSVDASTNGQVKTKDAERA